MTARWRAYSSPVIQLVDQELLAALRRLALGDVLHHPHDILQVAVVARTGDDRTESQTMRPSRRFQPLFDE